MDPQGQVLVELISPLRSPGSSPGGDGESTPAWPPSASSALHRSTSPPIFGSNYFMVPSGEVRTSEMTYSHWHRSYSWDTPVTLLCLSLDIWNSLHIYVLSLSYTSTGFSGLCGGVNDSYASFTAENTPGQKLCPVGFYASGSDIL